MSRRGRRRRRKKKRKKRERKITFSAFANGQTASPFESRFLFDKTGPQPRRDCYTDIQIWFFAEDAGLVMEQNASAFPRWSPNVGFWGANPPWQPTIYGIHTTIQRPICDYTFCIEKDVDQLSFYYLRVIITVGILGLRCSM